MSQVSEIDPYHVYSGEELKAIVGRKTAETISSLAFTRDRYLGSTILYYLDILGQEKVKDLLTRHDSIDSYTPERKPVKNHGIKDNRKDRSRLYSTTKP